MSGDAGLSGGSTVAPPISSTMASSVPSAGPPGAGPRLVQARFDFKATNNDELSLARGDVLTLTQALDGGWWEGTLHGDTGWFPSNYVCDYKGDNKAAPNAPKPVETSKKEHHTMVTGSFVDTEQEYVSQLTDFIEMNLRPLSKANLISQPDYGALCGNIEEICTFHKHFLGCLQDNAKLSAVHQRVGGIFMKNAEKVQRLYTSYARNHPMAVTVLTKCKEELGSFMEKQSSPAPGILALTTHLSLPFRRLDKYPALLKELERHIDYAHADRGDTQRALSLYKDLLALCIDVRKERELEVEIVTSTIKNWEGEEISSLGDVLISAQALLHLDGTKGYGDAKDRILLLFSSALIMISVSPTLTYHYEGKVATAGISVKKLEDSDKFSNALEISGMMIDKMVVCFNSADRQVKWYDKLMLLSKKSPIPCKPLHAPAVEVPMAAKSSVRALPVPLTHAKTAKVVGSSLLGRAGGGAAGSGPSFKVGGGSLGPGPHPSAHLPGPSASRTPSKPWTLSCLRPLPPARPTLTASPRAQRKTSTLGRRKSFDDSTTLQHDSFIYSVINAYCTSTKARHTVNSAILDSPSMIIPEEEKIFTEVTNGNQTIFEEKSLVDTVYAIKDQIGELRREQARMKADLEEEQRARRRWEDVVKSLSPSLPAPPTT